MFEFVFVAFCVVAVVLVAGFLATLEVPDDDDDPFGGGW